MSSFCLSNTTWQNGFSVFTKVTISQRRATTAYSRGNNTILSIYDLSPPEPTSYGPNHFFPIFDMAMANDTDDTTGLEYLYWIAGQGNNDTQYDAQMLLRQLIAVPVGIFNDPTFWGTYPNANLNTVGSLSLPSYRV